MRFLITCLLLFCFQSFVVCTKEDGAFTFAQKTITTSNTDKAIATLASKKESSESVKKPSFERLDRIHQNLGNHLYVVVNFLRYPDLILSIPLQSVKYLRANANHSYRFIFGCLYPKHTFW
ncbi:hypothetical protein FA048_12265 [Pedobacter polaris]|uniref:Uncharacterized protein n=1 Tax=Pedobacter polaris TaxID=2571273 RepID=A0A4U1CMP4_9SPHI|nr:hypothetical protein [Pedobacter polaris]TKC07933.1 hypothetical protein FA048_12265 [Pedobacter polaris]